MILNESSTREGFCPRKNATLEEMRKCVHDFLLVNHSKNNQLELIEESFVPAVAGTVDNPDGGTNGSYSIRVKLTDSFGRSVTTNLISFIVNFKEYFGLEQLKTEGNQVSVVFGCTKQMMSPYSIAFAFYEDNMLLSQESYWNSFVDTETFTSEIPENANKIKALLWGGNAVDSHWIFLNPMCPALELTKNEQGEWE